MANTLVIVESPAKAKTIGKYLGRDYVVRASMGHVRDLPADRLGVEVDKETFLPEYELVRGRSKTIMEIRQLAKEATTVLLATDPDREGEAIAWHVATAAGLGRRGQVLQRVEFHEITANAIRRAIATPRQIDMDLVNAQQARRVLDRLVGYKLSPLLWKKIQRGLSAGRVQSVALRVVVEREQEIEQFVPREFWTVEADLAKSPWNQRKQEVFRATLFGVDKSGKDKQPKKLEFENGEQAQEVVDALQGGTWTVAKVTKKEAKRHPSAPFTTSTLQQEASRKLAFNNKRTMQIAQQLYEGVSLGAEGNTGLITYMRTDSTNVSVEAQQAARRVIEQQFGADYLPEKPPYYAKKALGAQEAHEAVRPTSPERHPDAVRQHLSAEQYRLYRLIWQRFIASQMAPARLEVTTVDIDAQPKDRTKPPYLFRASGERVVFPGFMAVYRESRGDSADTEEESSLPELHEGNLLDLLKLLAEQHFTQPPPRYGEATLVKALEELGVGRPSTYATILSTIQDRGYVVIMGEGKEKKFRPTTLGRAVTELLVARFPDLLDVKFTAKLEAELDEVAEGKRQWTPLVGEVYRPMMARLALAEKEVGKILVAQDETPAPASSRPGSSRYSGRSGGSTRTGSGTGTGTRRPAAKTTTNNTTGATTRPRAAAKVSAETDPVPTRTRKPASTGAAPRAKKTTEPVPTPPVTDDYSDWFGAPVVAPTKTMPKAPPPPKPAAETGLTCEKCGKPMVKRKSQYGEFYGCSGFPNCRNIRKM